VIHVIDDDPAVCGASRGLFEAEGWEVRAHPSAEAFLAAPRPTGEVCLLVDEHLPGSSGVALLETLRAEGSRAPAIILTGHGDAATAVAALRAGAADFLEKPARASELVASIARAMERARDARARDAWRAEAAARFESLTLRERDVMDMVLAGAPNKNIAADLGISQRTVENHRAAVMRKTGATSLPALVRLSLAAADAT
jgi:two-component system CheB/CheR fusion protein